MREEFWNLLGFAWIEAISGSVPGTVRLQVRNADLCHCLGTAHDHLMVELTECEEFKLQPPLRPPMTNLPEIAAAGPHIKFAEADAGTVWVECEGNQLLTMRYQSARLSIAEGRLITVADLRRAGEEVWRMESERGW